MGWFGLDNSGVGLGLWWLFSWLSCVGKRCLWFGLNEVFKFVKRELYLDEMCLVFSTVRYLIMIWYVHYYILLILLHLDFIESCCEFFLVSLLFDFAFCLCISDFVLVCSSIIIFCSGVFFFSFLFPSLGWLSNLGQLGKKKKRWCGQVTTILIWQLMVASSVMDMDGRTIRKTESNLVLKWKFSNFKVQECNLVIFCE